jgi:hypothetical protein
MNRKAIVAIVVITISFSIGWLTYFGTNLLVQVLEDQLGSCNPKVHSCANQQRNEITVDF